MVGFRLFQMNRFFKLHQVLILVWTMRISVSPHLLTDHSSWWGWQLVCMDDGIEPFTEAILLSVSTGYHATAPWFSFTFAAIKAFFIRNPSFRILCFLRIFLAINNQRSESSLLSLVFPLMPSKPTKEPPHFESSFSKCRQSHSEQVSALVCLPSLWPHLQVGFS